ncbi:MAG: heavy metal-associated domain-containing protein [Spirosomataceae bacterium]
MKRLLFSLIFVFVASFVFADKGKEETVKIKTSAICEMCKERIEKNLAYTKGVSDVNLNLDDKVVTIKFNAKKTSTQKLKEVINKTGYDADEVPADKVAYEKLPSCCQKEEGGHSHH